MPSSSGHLLERLLLVLLVLLSYPAHPVEQKRRPAQLPSWLISYLGPISPAQGADDWTPRPRGTSPTFPDC